MLRYFTFEITKKKNSKDEANYETGWYISYPNGIYARKSLKKIRKEVKEFAEKENKPGYVSNTLTMAGIGEASVFKRRQKINLQK